MRQIESTTTRTTLDHSTFPQSNPTMGVTKERTLTTLDITSHPIERFEEQQTTGMDQNLSPLVRNSPRTRSNSTLPLEAWQLGDCKLSQGPTYGEQWERTELMISNDGADHMIAQIILHDEWTTKHLRIIDLSVPCRVTWPQNGSVKMLTFPCHLLGRSPLTGNVNGQEEFHSPSAVLAYDVIASIASLAAALSVSEAQTILGPVAALIRAAIHIEHTSLQVGNRTNSDTISQEVTQFIDENLCDPDLGPNSVLHAFHVSRATLYRMFPADGGIAQYIRNLRLNRAVQQIQSIAQKQSLTTLAYNLGFASSSSFSRAFKRKFGLNPSEFRYQYSKENCHRLDSQPSVNTMGWQDWFQAS